MLNACTKQLTTKMYTVFRFSSSALYIYGNVLRRVSLPTALLHVTNNGFSGK